MRKIEREMNNAVKNKIAWSKNNTVQLLIILSKIVLFIYMGITLLHTIMLIKSYHYMTAVGNLTPLSTDLMHYVMSLRLVFQYFKKTGIGL